MRWETLPVLIHFTFLMLDSLFLKPSQAVIEANIIGPLVHLLQNAELEIKKEAAWAISNATLSGSHEQIKSDITANLFPLEFFVLC